MKDKFQTMVAKAPQNTGGGNSQRSVLQYESALLIPTVNRRSTDGQSQSNYPLNTLKKAWKYVACMLLALVLGVGNMWGAINNTTVTKAGGTQKYIDVTTTAASNGDEVTVAKQYIAYTNSELTSSAIKNVWYTQKSSSDGSSCTDAVSITGYRSACNKYINFSSSKTYTFYVTNCVSFSVLYDPRANNNRYCIITATNVDDSEDVLSITHSGTVSSNNKYNVELTGLSASKYYRVVLSQTTSNEARYFQIRLGAYVNTTGPYAITYDKNDEGASGTMTDASSPYTKDATVTVLANTFTAPTGKVFVGWNTKANGSGTSYDAGDTFDATEDVTLYAQWAYPATGTGTITYTLTSNANAVSPAVSGVRTLSSSSTAFTVSTLECKSGNSKDGYSGQITGHAEDYSASQYVALQFTVADGYTFTPSAVSFITWVRSSNMMKTKVVISDGVTSIESNELTSTSDTDCPITFAADAFAGEKLKGNVNITMYQWGATGKRTYVKSPVTITGTVAAEAPKYDVVFANGGEGTGTMATLKYEAGEVVTLPACGYTPVAGREFDGWTSSDVTISAGKFTMPSKNVTITATWRDEAVKYTVTYDVNGGSSATPTETDKAAGDEFALAAAPEYDGYHFEGWLCDADAVTYDAEDAYTMTAANTTFTAQWKPYSTISIANKTYIIGSGNFNAVSDFSSNCEAAVSYELKESYSGVTLTPAGVFSATVAGEYIVVANQAGDATYAATSKEFTVTVLDNELTDTYVWKKASYTGSCVASPNADAPAAQYTSVTVDGMASVATGRPETAETDVTITIAATQTGFGITSLCVYGKSEEAAGFKYSWDGGVHWTDVDPVKDGDNYIDAKFTFNAPAGTFPDNIIIKFTEAEAGKGGLWLRNALVTLQVKKTVASTDVELNNVKVNGTAISGSDLSSLLTNKTLDIATVYTTAPTVTFVKRTTVNYAGGWPADVTDENIDVDATDATTNWSASQEIGENTYAITLAKPTVPSLETEATGFTLTSVKVATDTESFTFSGVNLGTTDVTISLENAVAGMTVSPAVVTPTDGAITDQEVTITYKSLDDVAEANVNLVVYYNEDTKITIPLTYSSTAGLATPNNVTGSIIWDFSKATASDVTISSSELTVLSNYAVANDPSTIVTDNLAAKGEKFVKNSNLRTFELQFTTTVNGKLSMDYSNTGGGDRPKRYFFVNGVRYGVGSDNNTKVIGEPVYVPAGLVTLESKVYAEGVDEAEWAYNNLQLYKMVFTETHDITFVGGGAVDAIHATNGEEVTLPEAAEIPEGKAFAGWFIDDVKQGAAGESYTMGSADVELTAKFITPAATPVIAVDLTNGSYCEAEGGVELDATASVSDEGVISYQWYNGTGAIEGATNAKYTAAAGSYYCIVTNTLGDAQSTTTSATAVITLKAGAVITAQPAAVQIVEVNNNVTVAIEAENATGYQWYKDGVAIEGATSASYHFTVTSVATATYYCKVAGICGEVQSNDAVVYMESGDCNTIGYGGTPFGTKGSEIAAGTYVTYKYGKSLSNYNILDEDNNSVPVTGGKMDGEYYFWTANTEIAAISTSVLTEGNTPGKYCVVFYSEAKYQPSDEKILSVVELTAGLENAAQKINVTPAPAGAKCARVIRAITWNETSYGESSQTYLYAARVCAYIPAQKPEFTVDLENKNVCALADAALAVTVAPVTDGGTLSYQWYNAEGAIEGATATSYAPEAEGDYYVIVTNTLAGVPSASTKSATATVSLKAQTEITGTVNVKGGLGTTTQKLSVTATGAGELSYAWYAYDNVNGATTGEKLSETNELGDLTITEETQYYQVTVTGDCGSVSEILTVEKWVAVERANVTGSRTWDWSTAGMGEVALVSGSVEYLMANVSSAVPNTEAFRSDMLLLTGNYANRGSSNKFFQGTQIRFYTEVPGKVSLECRAIHGTMTVTINGNEIDNARGTGMTPATTPFFVPAGWVTIAFANNATEGSYVGEAARIQKIVFNAEADYTRPTAAGQYGTICLPNGGVMVGAAIFEVAYMSYQNNTPYKVFFDEILNGEMVAGRPYIFMPNEDAEKIAVFYTDNANAGAGEYRGLHGTYNRIEGNDLYGKYIFYNNTIFMSENQANWLNENRAYIVLSEVQNYESAPAPGRRRVSMGVNAPAIATGLEDVQGNHVQCTKVLIDGQLYILRGEKMYDAKGQLVK